jgi:aminopeptidase
MNRKVPLASALMLGALLFSAISACEKREAQASPPPASAGSAAAEPATPAAPTDLEQLAARLVANANVKEGEIVLLTGGSRDLELLENLATNVQKVGAYPLVTYDSSRITRRSYTEVPEKYDTAPPKLDLALAEFIDASINITSNYTQGNLDDVPPARLAARAKTFVPVFEKYLKRMRSVAVGNELYPTKSQAEQLGMSEADLAKLFWEGVNVDYGDIQSRAETVRSQLAAAKVVRITAANGTDLTVNVAKRPVIVSDGIISDEDRKQGGAATWVFLPAGEVMVTPRPGEVEGKIVVDRLYLQGKPIENLTLTYVKGKLMDFTGTGAGFDLAKKQYEAVDDAKKGDFAVVDLGINPNLKLPEGNKVGTWMSDGMVTIGIGNNTVFGGENNAPFSLTGHLTNATVTLDGKPVVENGSLKL